MLLSVFGAGINFLGHQIATDIDGYEITANILTSAQGFFTEIFGYGGFFEYSGFHIIPFILGSIIWFIVGFSLNYIARNKQTSKNKYSFIGKILMHVGIGLAILSGLITFIICIASKDGFCVLIFVFLAVIFVPLFIVGLIFWIVSRYLKELINPTS